jgi:hypothetical protein
MECNNDTARHDMLYKGLDPGHIKGGCLDHKINTAGNDGKASRFIKSCRDILVCIIRQFIEDKTNDPRG